MPRLSNLRISRAIVAGLATLALVVGGAIAFSSPAFADTPPDIEGSQQPDEGLTSFVEPTSTGCSYGVDDQFDFYYQQGWTVIPPNVHHALVSAVGEAGIAGINSGAAGGLGGGISAIVPAYPGQIFYASPTASPTQDYEEVPPYGTDANGGYASFISTVPPTQLFPTHDSLIPNPNDFCQTEFDPFSYPATMPPSDLVVVAGGGGGGGPFNTGGVGGNAGPSGSAGHAASAGSASGGGGGSQSAGGAGGAGNSFAGYAGSYLAGGDNFNPNVVPGGGGGGGGYYGGGSGGTDGSTSRGGGGGGSNYVESLPNDGVSKLVSNGTSTQASQVSIIPIYEPTVTIAAPVNPSVVGTPTTITATVSGLPTTNSYRSGGAGTVNLLVNGVPLQRSLDPLVGPDTGVRTATFTQTPAVSGTVTYSATYNGDTSHQSALQFAYDVQPESSGSLNLVYRPEITASVAGSMTYGDSTATFTHSESLPSGVTISGTATCTTANGGHSLSTVAAGSQAIDPASCSGLTLGGPNAANYALAYAGSVAVAREQVSASIGGSQALGGSPTFMDVVSPSSATSIVSGSPTCTTLADGTAIGPTLARGVYALGSCAGLSLAGPNAADYQLTVIPGQFVAGTSTPTLTIPALASAVAGTPLDTRVTLSGGDEPSGDVNLTVYDSANCTGTVLYSGTAAITGSGDYDTGSVTPEQADDISIEANYTGDTFNSSSVTACDDVAVAKADAGVTFTVPATAVVGQPTSASATLSSSVPRASGSYVNFFLFPPSDTTCTGNIALVDQSVPVSGDGVYTSPTYTPSVAGTYRWVIIYGGDTNHTLGYTICQPVVVGSPPSVTSSAAATLVAGASGNFTITTAAGSPAATTLSAAGTLPVGVTFTDNGDGTATFHGTPGAQTGGSYPITITAANTIASSIQHFVLTVAESPTITSSNAATFTAGDSSSFAIATSAGYPVDTTLSLSGALPAGVTFTDDHDGTGRLSGAPDPATGGSYPLTITAGNGSAPDAIQGFTLTVEQAPAITTAGAATFTTGAPSSFTIATSAGFPTATALSIVGALPTGVSFTDNQDGTATLAGIPAPATGGSYPLTITAGNGTAHDATQSFTLTVEQSPIITSTDTTTFTAGHSSSFTIVTSAGYPTDTALTLSGALPAGITFTDNSDGTATVSGTPGNTTGGSYPLTITAGNGNSPDSIQGFTLTVTQPVAIAGSDQATFLVGQNGSHSVTTTIGYPSATTLTLTGALPAGVSFTDDGDGTGSIAGTPLVGSGGQYPVAIAASNGIGTAAVQDLVITVDESPAITSADTETAIIGVTSNFDVTTSPGYPTAYSLSASGALPAGLSLTIAGGSATIDGVPTGPAGDYPVTLTASNGVAPGTVQTLIITIAGASPVPLPPVAPTGGGISGVPAVSHPGHSFTASATGFAPGAPITWGIYSAGRVLTTSVADSSGDATARLTIPAAFAGVHTIVVTGIAPDGSSRVLSATTTVITPPAVNQLSTTGIAAGSWPIAATLLLLVGLALLVAARVRRTRRRAAGP
jgi:hypothetical protein